LNPSIGGFPLHNCLVSAEIDQRNETKVTTVNPLTPWLFQSHMALNLNAGHFPVYNPWNDDDCRNMTDETERIRRDTVQLLQKQSCLMILLEEIDGFALLLYDPLLLHSQQQLKALDGVYQWGTTRMGTRMEH
jgi:hypothetical protein